MESKKTVPTYRAPVSDSAPAADRTNPDRFSLVRALGEGSMGIVYEAVDRHTGTHVALKTLSGASPAALYHLKNEFRALTDVVHPNLVTLHELIVDSTAQFFTMELVHGVPFDDYVRVGFRARESFEPPAPRVRHAADTVQESTVRLESANASVEEPTIDHARMVRALLQLAEGIDALHRAGKLHRDLKPSNVLVTASGNVKILDFGLVSDGSTDPVGQTMGNRIAGTPVYMSPEQAAGEWATPASDWYAFGVMIYEMVTGRVPFDGPIYDVLTIKQRQLPKPPSRYAQVPEALEALCMSLLCIDPTERPGGQAVLAKLGELAQRLMPEPVSEPPLTAASGSVVSGMRPVSPFVGREAELQLLRDTLRDTERGTPWLVHVTGASGIGKSTLVTHFAEGTAADPRCVVLRGRCYERESVPYKGMDGVIDALSRHLRRLRTREVLRVLPRHVQALCRVFPVLARVDSIMAAGPRSAELPIDPAEQRRLAWGALRELLARVADDAPLLLCVDDFQWADRDSAQLLAALIAPPYPPPLMVLLTYREDARGANAALAALREELARNPVQQRHVELAGLGAAHVGELVSTALPLATSQDVRRCLRETDGNPFLVHELLRRAQRNTLGPSGADVKLDLDAVMRERVAALSDDCRNVLQAAALAARPTHIDVLAQVTEAADVRAAVRKLQADSLVRTSTKSPYLVETYHDRLREAVINTLTADQQRALHARLAAMLLRYDGDPETLAEHYLAAGDVEQALTQALRAAPRAERALSFDRAARFYRVAVELAERTRPSEARLLHVRLAESLASSGRCLDAAGAYDAAAARSEPEAAARLRLLAATQLLLSGRAEEGMGRLDRSLSAYGVPTFRDETHATEHIGKTMGEYFALAERLEPNIVWRAASELSEDDLTRLDVLHCAAIGLAWLDMGSRYFALALEDAKASLQSREPLRVLNSGSLLGSLFESLGGSLPPSAASLVAQARALVDDPVGHGWAEYATGASAYFRGRFPEAYRALQRAEATFRNRCRGAARESTIVRIPLLIALRWSGRLPEVMDGCERWGTAAREQGDVFTDLWMQLLDIAPLCRDLPEQARQRVEDSYAKLERFVSAAGSPSSAAVVRVVGQVRRAEVDWYEGRDALAYEHIRALWSERSGDNASLVGGDEAALRLPLHSMQVVWHRARAFCGMLAARGTLDAKLQAELEELLAQHAAFTIPTMTTPALLHAAVARVDGDLAQAARLLLEEAENSETLHENSERAACLRLQAGRLLGLLGDDDGRLLVQRAEAYLRSVGVVDPTHWARVIAPGF